MSSNTTSDKMVWYGAEEITFNNKRPVSEGGFCKLYKGMVQKGGQAVALKRVENWGLVQAEAAIWHTLRHRNVLLFLGLLPIEGHIYLVSPWVDNGSLRDFISQHPDVDRIKLLKDVAEGLAYLHRCEVVHGDVKGPNVLIATDIRAMLCDFGLAKVVGTTFSVTEKGVGTLPWVSPERLQGGSRSFKDDVYAFGMTIFEALSNSTPFSHYREASAIILAVCTRNERPPQHPMTSPTGQSYGAAWDLAKQCWNSALQDRPPMEEVLANTCFTSLVLITSTPSPGPIMASSLDPSSEYPITESWTNVHEAVRSRQPAVLNYLIGRGVDVNIRYREGLVTPLLIAAIYGDVDLVTILLRAGANPNTRALNGTTALWIVCEAGNLEVAKILFDWGAKQIPHNCADTPLNVAIASGFTELAECLIMDPDVDLNEKEKRRGFTPLIIATTKGDLAIVTLLIDHKVDIRATDQEKLTALCYAALTGDLPIVKLLLNADPGQLDTLDLDVTPETCAIRQGHVHVLKYLEEVQSKRLV